MNKSTGILIILMCFLFIIVERHVVSVEEIESEEIVIYKVAWSPNSPQLVATSSVGAYMYSLDASEVTPTLLGEETKFESATFSPDAKWIAVGGWDSSTVSMYETQNYELQLTLGTHADAITAMSFSPDGNTLAVAGNEQSPDQMIRGNFSLQILNLPEGIELALLHDDIREIVNIEYSPESIIASMVSIGGNPDVGTVQMFNSVDLSLQSELPWQPISAFPAINRYFSLFGVVAPEGYGILRLWDMQKSEVMWETILEDGVATSVAISPDSCNSFLVSGNAFGDVYLWDIESGDMTTSFPDMGGYVKELEINFDGQFLAAVVRDNEKDDHIEIWSIQKRHKVESLYVPKIAQ